MTTVITPPDDYRTSAETKLAYRLGKCLNWKKLQASEASWKCHRSVVNSLVVRIRRAASMLDRWRRACVTRRSTEFRDVAEKDVHL